MKSISETVVRSPSSDHVLVIMAKAPRPGCGQNPPRSQPFSRGSHRFLLLSLGRHAGAGAIIERCGSCHHVPDSDYRLAQLAGNGASVVAQKGEGLAAGLTSVFAHFAAGHHDALLPSQRQPTPAAYLFSKRVRNAGRTLTSRWTTHDGGYSSILRARRPSSDAYSRVVG